MTMLRLILAVVLAVGAGAFIVPPPGCSRVCAPKGAYPLTVVTSRTRAATIALHAKKTKESDVIEVDGIVKESLPNAKFRVELVATKNVIVCSTSGKMRKNFVRVLVGDPVKVELSPYDLTRGRITYRSKGPGKKTVEEKPLEKAEEKPAEKPEEGAGE